MLRTAFLWALWPLPAGSRGAPLAAADPSFDCRTARTARELATCADARIAAADRELAAGWQNAIAGLDPATVKALRADQKKFLEDLDSGFEGEVWGKQSPPEGKELRAQIARLRRGGDFDALADLEAQLRERLAFLRNLHPPASYAGRGRATMTSFGSRPPAARLTTARPSARPPSAGRNTIATSP